MDNNYKLLSFDIGIVNLAYCKLDGNYNVIDWNVLDFSARNKDLCSHISTKGKCKKVAKYEIMNNGISNHVCEAHKKTYKKIIIWEEIDKIKGCNFVNTQENECGLNSYYKDCLSDKIFCKKHKEILQKDPMKLYVIKNSQNKKNVYDESMHEIITNLYDVLDTLQPIFMDLDGVIIENQLGHMNKKMTTISMLLYSYIMIKYIRNKDSGSRLKTVKFVSAYNKFKVEKIFNESYLLGVEINKGAKNKKKNKTACEKICQSYLKNNKSKWTNFFSEHKKKDDLTDSYFLGLYEIKENKNGSLLT